jgi:hypothetical protein
MNDVKRNLILALAVAAALALAGGAALAKVIECGGGRCEGTKRDDEIIGRAGDDSIGRAADGDRDADTVFGGKGNENILVGENGQRDVVDCGPGTDSVSVDQGLDTVINCELLDPR